MVLLILLIFNDCTPKKKRSVEVDVVINFTSSVGELKEYRIDGEEIFFRKLKGETEFYRKFKSKKVSNYLKNYEFKDMKLPNSEADNIYINSFDKDGIERKFRNDYNLVFMIDSLLRHEKQIKVSYQPLFSSYFVLKGIENDSINLFMTKGFYFLTELISKSGYLGTYKNEIDEKNSAVRKVFYDNLSLMNNDIIDDMFIDISLNRLYLVKKDSVMKYEIDFNVENFINKIRN
ncbi:hypothetical protein Y10_22180 [Neptunitalea sp. Y10]|uniref:Uncharacterized protein n=2 Tax=Neptunitalea lumnitzerae TaxID=2965509 RepID=A0ABQ5MLA7_9FLAO|nr:hypothetical protein Y10_22180 [Neptunitalea sp. Y10]